jgi:biopolymer transport protein ExbD
MAVSDMSAGQKGGRKAVDSELNLIPFIDLLSVCILFLLMTAVWVQISKMSAFSQPTGQATVRHSEVSSINEMREGRTWDVLIRTKGIEVRQNRRSLGTYPAEGIEDVFVRLKKKLPNPEKAKVAVRAADDVVYDNVIIVLDALMAVNLTNVTIGGLN